MEETKDCRKCKHCVFQDIGEYLCNATIPLKIVQNFMPNENYGYCGGLGYENKEEEEKDER